MIRTKDSLAELIQSKEFIPYVDGASDPREEKVRWTVLGDCRYNLLWIVVSNITTGEQFIECIKSIVPTPIREREFGLEDADAGWVSAHSDDMWNKYKEKLKTP